MTPTSRKTGLRLPWSHEDEPEESDARETPSEPSADATAMTPASTAGATSETTAPVTSAAAASAPTAGSDSATPGEPSGNGNDLLASLVVAMRDVAEHERESSLAGLRGSVEEAIATLRQRASAGADELRQRAETDIAGIGEWVKVETARIVAEGDRKIEGRRQQLTTQLTDHEQQGQHEIESLHARVAEYERELAAFFAQLNEIDDPAAFGAAAKRMPRPPTLAGQAAPASPSAPATPTAPASTPAPSEAPAAPDAETTDTSAADDEAQMVANHRTRLDALGLARDESAAEPAAAEAAAEEASAEPTTVESPPLEATTSGNETEEAEPLATTNEPLTEDDNPLRTRLAELDAAIGPDEAKDKDAGAGAQGRASEVATAIVVHGLGSFGAITSFKQALERVDGVHGISLALGPTGEFVYRATHDAGFDVVGAIEKVENGAAQIERQPDGSLRVTVQRTR
jgi:hypothetical protein